MRMLSAHRNIGTAFFLGVAAGLLGGCASPGPSAPPPVDAAPPSIVHARPSPSEASFPFDASAEQASWLSKTREGREALLARDFPAAEAAFVAALASSGSFRSMDVRVDVSFGNVVRLASVYERIGQPDDARRLTELVEETAGRRRLAVSRVAGFRARFKALAESPLHSRFDLPTASEHDDMPTYDRLIQTAATSFDVDPALVKAIVATESNFEPRAVSRVGAQGLMQLMPDTARAMGVRRPFTPSENILGGVRYLRSLLDRFEDLDHALAAYNAGPDAVVRYGGIPPYAETEAYVTKVMSHYRRYQARFNP